MLARRFNQLKLSQQFLLVAMSVTLLIISGVSVYMVRSSIHARVEQLQLMADARSASVIEKVDRNFYERFGDVQAFAYNRLAIETATDSVSVAAQQFINTMVRYYVLYDLMMICDGNGNVVATNTVDKTGVPVKADFLMGKNFRDSDWFAACMQAGGPQGGAWYSDFMLNDDVTRLYNRPGWGMAFAAPIKNDAGQTVGVWYNFANWNDVTVGIRKSNEELLKKTVPGSFIVVTNAQDELIDAEQTELLLKQQVSSGYLAAGGSFQYQGKEITEDDYIIGSVKGTGAYTYKGKNWNALTFIQRTRFSIAYVWNNLAGFLSVMVVVLIVTGFVFYKLASSVGRTLTNLKQNIEQLARGELADVRRTRHKNEVGAITSALQRLTNRTRETAAFAKAIGEGDLHKPFAALGEQDVLGQALVTMQGNLQKIQREEQARTWVSEGLARFASMLRNQTDWQLLSSEILSGLISFINANQGALFVLNEDDGAEVHLEMAAAYAWNRKKYLTKRIAPGEGLVGQCWLENHLIYLREVPKEFIRITSGLGEAVPSTIILLPLQYHEKTYGVLELASFKEFEPHHQEFLQRVCEMIAATIAAARTAFTTQKLLQQHQQQAEEMRAQEEEMRQNMEELSATQEELARKEREYLRQIDELQRQVV